jgi:hypothetical protein
MLRARQIVAVPGEHVAVVVRAGGAAAARLLRDGVRFRLLAVLTTGAPLAE